MFHGFPTGTPSAVSSRAEPGLAMCVTLNGPSHNGDSLCRPSRESILLSTRSFQGREVAFYRQEREHEARGSAERARPVLANEGEGRSGLSAEGCGVLWGAAGALAGCGVVWCRGCK
jgi:hypothetical protein